MKSWKLKNGSVIKFRQSKNKTKFKGCTSKKIEGFNARINE